MISPNSNLYIYLYVVANTNRSARRYYVYICTYIACSNGWTTAVHQLVKAEENQNHHLRHHKTLYTLSAPKRILASRFVNTHWHTRALVNGRQHRSSPLSMGRSAAVKQYVEHGGFARNTDPRKQTNPLSKWWWGVHLTLVVWCWQLVWSYTGLRLKRARDFLVVRQEYSTPYISNDARGAIWRWKNPALDASGPLLAKLLLDNNRHILSPQIIFGHSCSREPPVSPSNRETRSAFKYCTTRDSRILNLWCCCCFNIIFFFAHGRSNAHSNNDKQ